VHLLQVHVLGKRCEVAKNSRPFPKTLKGRECREANVYSSEPYHTRGATLIASLTGEATFYLVIAGVETIHLSYLSSVIVITIDITYKRLSSVSRSRMRSESAIPFRTFTLLRIAVGDRSHTVFAQRGSKRIVNLVCKDTSQSKKCQIEKKL
jgi:hypothetical protein